MEIDKKYLYFSNDITDELKKKMDVFISKSWEIISSHDQELIKRNLDIIVIGNYYDSYDPSCPGVVFKSNLGDGKCILRWNPYIDLGEKNNQKFLVASFGHILFNSPYENPDKEIANQIVTTWLKEIFHS